MTTVDSIPADVLRAAVLKALAEEVKTAIEDGKAGLKPVMDTLKIGTLDAELPDGTQVGEISRAGGTASPKVTDPVKFLGWVEENRPGEVVRSVRESYQKALLEDMKKAGKAVDPATGDVVPGVEFVPSSEYLVVRYAGEGKEAIRRAWQAGRIDLGSMLALPAGGEPGAE